MSRNVESVASKIEQLLAQFSDVETFLNQDGEAFALLSVNSRTHLYPTRSTEFSEALTYLFFQRTNKSPGSTAVADLIGVLNARARFEGKRREVFTRIGKSENTVFIDLGESNRAIEVDEKGWRISGASRCLFYRPTGLKALPEPVRTSATLESLLKPLVNVQTESGFKLLIGWLISAMRPSGPYPVLIVHGEQGGAKSSLCGMLRALIDPNTAPLRGQPRCEDDFILQARNAWLVVLDNISAVPDWLSDSMCRVATGGGLSKRRLYTDGQEVLYNVQRPQILNGIESLGERGDLLSRSIILELAPIAPQQRKTYRQFWTAFERVHGAIFGKLLDAVSMAIRNQDSVSLGANPSRLSDFCAWVRAACPALGWQPTQFDKAYLENRMVADWTALDASPLLKHLRSISQHRAYSGTASDLLEKLNSLSGPGELWSASWPKTPRGLVGQLARLAPSLRQAGIVIERNRRAGGNRDRLLTLRVFDPDEDQGMDPQASLPL